MIVPGQQIELTIEKPASGGRMIARHLGQVVLVSGAIPGERVKAWVERVDKRVAFASAREVVEPSPDRRVWEGDPLCGGTLYAHIAYARQLTIKADVIRDAFARLGRHPIEGPIDVRGSPDEGYRMRARLHVRGSRAGFYREGTHQVCDPAPTRQLLPDTTAIVETLIHAIAREAPDAVTSLTITENMAADQRAAYLELKADARLQRAPLERAVESVGLQGISARGGSQPLVAGSPWVTDSLAAVTGAGTVSGDLRRHAESFFQGNRYLLPALVQSVMDAVPDEGPVLDLYAGVGLFSTALAASRQLDVTAVEGDRSSGADLVENARAFAPRLSAVVADVERYLRAAAREAATIVVDPPRTGMSKDAVDGILTAAPRRIVYVSCDPPTLARDTRRLLDGGYSLVSVRAFDLFPNTPHVEVLSVFTRG